MEPKRWKRPTRASGWGLLGLGAASLLACEAPQEEGSPDPAGTGAPSSPVITRYELQEPPLFQVSGGTSEDGTLRWTYTAFGSGAVAILPSGGVVAGNEDRLVFLDTLGRPRAISGRPGRGPGEFERVARVFIEDSTVVAWDPVLDRVSFWSESGGYLGGLTFREGVGTELIGWIPGVGAVSRDRYPLPWGAPIEYLVRGLDGRVEHAMKGPVRHPILSVVTPVGIRVFSCSPPVLDAVAGTRVFSVDPLNARVYMIPLGGSMRDIYTPRERRLVRSDHLDWIDRSVGAVGASRGTRREAVRQFGRIGDPLPSQWTRVVGDPTGRLWLRLAKCLADVPGVEWEIISSEGEPIGLVETRHHVVAVRGDLVAATSTDSLGVTWLRLHRMVPVHSTAASR
jgi:hypothetical protein